MWKEQKLSNFETTLKEVQTRALSIEILDFYQVLSN